MKFDGRFGRDVKIVHFIGPLKPWHYTYNTENGRVYTPSGSQGYIPHERTFLQLWWDIYVTFVQPEMRVGKIFNQIFLLVVYIKPKIFPRGFCFLYASLWDNT